MWTASDSIQKLKYTNKKRETRRAAITKVILKFRSKVLWPMQDSQSLSGW